MPDTDQSIESLIQAKGKTAPRVTPADIAANIASEHYFTAADGYAGALSVSPEFAALSEEERFVEPPEQLDLLTFCVIVAQNGFTFVGTSACASPENFDPEIGKRIARENAVQQMWPARGYALKQQLSEAAA